MMPLDIIAYLKRQDLCSFRKIFHAKFTPPDGGYVSHAVGAAIYNPVIKPKKKDSKLFTKIVKR